MIKGKIWWPFVLHYKWRIGTVITIGFLSSYFSLLLPLSIGKYMGLVFNSENSKTKALELLGINLPNNITIFFTFFSGLLIIKFLCNWLHQYQASLLGESFVASLRKDLYRHQLHIKNTGLQEKPGTSILLTFSNDAKLIQQLLVKGVIGFTKEVLFLLIAIYVLFQLHMALTGIVVFLIITFYTIQRWYNRKQRNTLIEKRRRHSSLLNHVSKSVYAEAVSQEADNQLYDQKSDRFKKALEKYHLQKSFLRALAPLMLYGMLGVIMAFIILYLKKENFKAAEVFTYILLLMSLFPTIRIIIKIEHVWIQGNLSAQKFNPLAGKKNPETEKSNRPSIKV